jgi:hypothetical protein
MTAKTTSGNGTAKRSKANPEQSRRFIDMARELGCEENFDRLDQALKRARVKPGPVPPPKPEKEELPD